MHIMTVEGWKPLAVRNCIPAPDQEHWNSAELKAKVEAYMKGLRKEIEEMQADRISRHGFDIFAK